MDYLFQLIETVKLLPFHVFLKDMKGQFLAYGKPLLEVLKDKTQLPLGHSIPDEMVFSKREDCQVEEKYFLNGKEYIFITQKTPLFDIDNNPIGLIGISIEVGTFKQEEELLLKKTKESGFNFELRENLIYVHNVLENLPLTFFWMDKEGKILASNYRQVYLFGLKSTKELVGKNIHDVGKLLKWDDSIAEEITKNNLKVIAHGKPLEFEEKVVIDGEERIFLSCKHPMSDASGKFNGIFGFAVDITERKKTEEALRIAKEEAEKANKAKTDFMELMTHELRTPLNGMLGMLEAIMEHPHETIEKNLLELKNIQHSGELLLAHVNDILDYAKFKKGKFNLVPSVFNLPEIIKSTVNTLKPNAHQKNVDIMINYSDKLPQNFFADKNRFSQILYNLIGNAVKFTYKGSIHVYVDCVKKNKTQARMKITIMDTGVGIPKNKLKVIFNKFEQVSSSLKEARHGTGLGLAIVKQLVKKFQGEIFVESKIGIGSAFTIILPLTIAQKTIKNNKSQRSSSGHRHTFNGCHILLIEDNEINQMVAQKLLEILKCKVQIANCGKAGLEMIKNNKFDLIFMDINLPDMDGFTVASKIRDKFSMPIIAMTANASQENRKRCYENGMNAIVEKPISINALTNVLLEWVA